MSEKKRVVVAMSGGVDSSVAAALLVQSGYDVIGMMMRLWSEPGSEADNRCCTPDAMALARRVAAILGIPFYAVDAQETFYSQVVTYFLDGYAQGVTPNPCLACNRHIRWQFLLQRALALGATHMATGHYARLQTTSSGRIQLLMGVDLAKDQSYVLHVLNQQQLSHALFPLGEYTKPQVRELARQFKLPVAERHESQDLCFLGNGSYRSFLSRHLPLADSESGPAIAALSPGPILTQDGQQIGQHQGLSLYTIGQRKGLGIAAPHPLYVLSKDLATNALVVGPLEALGSRNLTASQVNWVSGQVPIHPFRSQAKIRYKSPLAWAGVTPLAGSRLSAVFDEPLRDITPGQAFVMYDGDEVLGGGVIVGSGQE